MQKLLIIADPLGSKQIAIPRGLAMAAKIGCGAEIVGFCHETPASLGLERGAAFDTMKTRLLESQRDAVAEAVSKAKFKGPEPAVTLAWQKDVHTWVVKRCHQKQFEAVVKTGHTEGTLIYTSTDWMLLRECTAPILIVTKKRQKKGGKILAAVDLSTKSKVKFRLSHNVIEAAQLYADAIECELHLIHVLHVNPVLTELDLVDQTTYENERRAAIKPRIDDVSERYNIPKKQIHVKRGPVDKVICSEAARLQSQLVVLGTVGRRGLKAAMLGNTAEQVLLHLGTDVLAVRP